MKMRYVHAEGGSFVELWTETDAEARMLAALEPMDHVLGAQVTLERNGVYAGAPIKSLQIKLTPVKMADPEPLG